LIWYYIVPTLQGESWTILETSHWLSEAIRLKQGVQTAMITININVKPGFTPLWPFCGFRWPWSWTNGIGYSVWWRLITPNQQTTANQETGLCVLTPRSAITVLYSTNTYNYHTTATLLSTCNQRWPPDPQIIYGWFERPNLEVHLSARRVELQRQELGLVAHPQYCATGQRSLAIYWQEQLSIKIHPVRIFSAVLFSLVCSCAVLLGQRVRFVLPVAAVQINRYLASRLCWKLLLFYFHSSRAWSLRHPTNLSQLVKTCFTWCLLVWD